MCFFCFVLFLRKFEIDLFFREVLGSPHNWVESRAQSFRALCRPFPQKTVFITVDEPALTS